MIFSASKRLNSAKMTRSPVHGLIGPAIPDSEEWFRLLLETLPHMAFVIGPASRSASYNQRFVEYLGFLPGADRASRTALHHPDDRAKLESARSAGVRANTEYIVEARMRRHDGVYRWHRIHNKPLLRDGRAVAWLGTAVDVHDVVEANEALEQKARERTRERERVNETLADEIELRRRTEAELRESEQRYRTLYNRTPVALQSVDADAKLIDINDTWTEMFGYGRDEALGRSPMEFMTPESAASYQTETSPETLASPGGVRTADFQFVAKSGRVFDGRLSARGEFDAAGGFVRSWSAISDITEEKRAAWELRQIQRTESVGQLTAGIAHDFNNLLTAILGNLELLARPSRDAERFERLLGGARSAAERGARVTQQLLAFSRQQRIVAEPVDVNALVEAMAPLLRGTIGATIEITITPTPDPPIALADATQLELAVVNLAINARDAMPDGGAITITTATVHLGDPTSPEEPAAGDYVEVAVADTGSGISREIRDKIFDPFFTTKDVGKGTGLGLPQALGMVKRLGGGLSVTSRAGAGTRVAILLPLADQLAGTASDAHLAPAEADTASARRAMLLVVDDDNDVRATAADMLRDHGYTVIEAESGAAALAFLARPDFQPALMIADIAMPGMTGVELAGKTRVIRPALPVLFMTGYAGANRLPPDGRHDVLTKPFQTAELLAKVTGAMEQSLEPVKDRAPP
jgi:PAS domain S-box-containing protein